MIRNTVFNNMGLGFWQACCCGDGLGVTAPKEALSTKGVMNVGLNYLSQVPIVRFLINK
jgi:hypothetical protein